MYDAPSKSKHVNKAELDYIEQDKYVPFFGAHPVDEATGKQHTYCIYNREYGSDSTVVYFKNTNVTPDIYYATKSSYNATNYT